MIPDPREQPTMKVEDAGRELGLSRSAAYEAARRGELPTLRFGRRLVVATAVLRRMLALDVDEAPVGTDASVTSIDGRRTGRGAAG